MLKKISLAERLHRLEAGYASSPQVTRILVDTFCKTPVAPLLEEYGAYYERERLCKVLKNNEIKQYFSTFDFGSSQRKHLEDVTYGDLAALIAAHYMRYGCTPSSFAVEELICIYFCCIEALTMRPDTTRPKVQREDLKPGLRPIYDFLHMSFVEYYEYAKQCGLGQYAEKIDRYREHMGFSSSMTPLMIFDEMKLEHWDYSEPCFVYSKGGLPSISQCEHLLDFFVSPVSAIWMAPFADRT